MPTYEYVCTSCGHAWEAEQRITEDPLKTCPKCSQASAKRQVSGGNFILKGGGWYADLYSSPKPSSGGSGSGSGSGSSGSSGTGTSTGSSGSGGGSSSGSGSGGSSGSSGSSGGAGSGGSSSST